MVLLHTFQDIIDSFPQVDSFSLPTLKQNPLKIAFSDDNTETKYAGVEPPLPFANSEVFHAGIIHWRRLTSTEGDCKAVYEVTFDVKDSKFNFRAGDTIGVIPHNDESDVNLVITHLNLCTTADVSYTLNNTAKGSKLPAHVPVKSTLRYVLTHGVDLRCILKKLFLLALSKYTKDEKERKFLEYLCSKEGSTAYSTLILNNNLCLLDIFTLFKTCKPPIELVLSNLPRLLPRPYSIVNSGLKNNKELKICFSVMASNNRKGLTTGWLERLILNEDLILEKKIKDLNISKEFCENQRVPIYLRNNFSMFHLPEALETPLILIGPGTGVSPFIGFLEEREYLRTFNNQIKLGLVWLFFGCRNPEYDFIYKEELNGFLSRETLNKLCTAFSRVSSCESKYIQDSLLQNGKEVTQLIKDGASVFICGDLKTMAAEVKEVLVKCLMEHDCMTLEEAQSKISEMHKDKRYLVDAWS